MGLATEPPARLDLALFTDDDRLVGAKWLAADGVTPVPVTEATLSMLFDQPPTQWIDGEPQPQPDPVRHTINSTDAGDANGWVDVATPGVVLVTLPASMWASIDADRLAGTWNLVAVSDTGVQRCLLRGQFSAEAGVKA